MAPWCKGGNALANPDRRNAGVLGSIPSGAILESIIFLTPLFKALNGVKGREEI